MFLETKKKMLDAEKEKSHKLKSSFAKTLFRNETNEEKMARLATEDKIKLVLTNIKNLNRFKLKLSDYFMYALILKVYGIDTAM